MDLKARTTWNFEDALKMTQILYALKHYDNETIKQNIHSILEQHEFKVEIHEYFLNNGRSGVYWDYAGIVWNRAGSNFVEQMQFENCFGGSKKMIQSDKNMNSKKLIETYSLDNLVILQHETLEYEIYNYIVNTGACFAQQPNIKKTLELETHYFLNELTNIDDVYLKCLINEMKAELKEAFEKINKINDPTLNKEILKEYDFLKILLNKEEFNSIADITNNKNPDYKLLIPSTFHSCYSETNQFPAHLNGIKILNLDTSSEEKQRKIINLLSFDLFFTGTKALKSSTKISDPIILKDDHIIAISNLIMKPEQIPSFCFDGESFKHIVDSYQIQFEINKNIKPTVQKRDAPRF